jgi:hypothetical protein
MSGGVLLYVDAKSIERTLRRFSGQSAYEVFSSLLKFPTDKSPAGGDMVRHVRSVGGFGIAYAADDNHPVEKLSVTGLQEILHRVIHQTPPFPLPHDFQELVVELGIDLADPR